jgi:aldose 1-epimerase
MKNLTLTLLSAMLLASCANRPAQHSTLSGLDPARFTTTLDGAPVALYTLTNASGMEVCVTNLGGRIVSAMVPDRDGVMHDVVLGFDNAADYAAISNNFGATIGRYANRIGAGRFTLDGNVFQLPLNNGPNTLHGGTVGWDARVWEVTAETPNSLEMTLTSPDADQNFPGNVTARVSFTLTDENAIDINYSAVTDKPTVINMTNHSYFNLSGDPSRIATDHILWIDADGFTPIDPTSIPTGEITPVASTPMDFTVPKAIARDIDADTEQLRNGRGYDHNWVLNTAGDINRPAARLTSPVTGIVLEVYTTEPGLQIYTGNFLDGSITGKGGVVYNRRASVCLETQKYPDTPNKPDWPTARVDPGQTYTSRCVYKFLTEN